MQEGESEAVATKKAATKTPETKSAVVPVDSISVKKDSCKTLRVISIVLAAILVLVSGLTIWYFAYYNNPEKVAFDAVENILKADHISLRGGYTIMPKDLDDDDILKMVLISFDTSDKALPNTNSAKIQFILDTNKIQLDEPLVVSMKNIVMKDGMIYFQLGGLTNAFHGLLEVQRWANPEVDTGDYEDILDYIDEFLADVEDEWWQISLSDILDEMEVSKDESDVVQNIYGCVTDLMNSDWSGTYEKLYRDNRFIKVEPTKYFEEDDADAHSEVARGHNVYSISLDSEKFADFLNQMPETDVMQDFVTCYNEAGKELDLEPLDFKNAAKITADEVQWPDNLRVAAEISRVGHKLRSVYVSSDTDYARVDGSVLIAYEAATTETPESYRSVTDLVDEVANLLTEIFSTAYDTPSWEDPDDYDYIYEEDNCDDSMNCVYISEEDVWVY